jgi:hypothetical protein
MSWTFTAVTNIQDVRLQILHTLLPISEQKVQCDEVSRPQMRVAASTDDVATRVYLATTLKTSPRSPPPHAWKSMGAWGPVISVDNSTDATVNPATGYCGALRPAVLSLYGDIRTFQRPYHSLPINSETAEDYTHMKLKHKALKHPV